MHSIDQELTLRAAVVARAHPELWANFINALSAYSGQAVANCIQSPLDSLPVFQGRAQATARLLDILANCSASADKIEGKRK